MTNATLIAKLRSIHDSIENEPDTAAEEVDTLIEDLLEEEGNDAAEDEAA